MLNAIMRDGLVNVPVKILGFTSNGAGDDAAIFVDCYKGSPFYNQIQAKCLWDGGYRSQNIQGRFRFVLTPENEGS